MVQSLGEVAWRRENLVEAAQLLERDLRVQEAKVDPESPYCLVPTLHTLTCVRRDPMRYREAEELFVRALSIRESKLGTVNVRTRDTRREYAELLRRAGRAAAAAELQADSGPAVGP